MKIDLGKLTQEESAELLKRLITDALTEEQVFSALNEVLTTEQKEELGESWFNLGRER
jgi:hypothetical protein